MLIKIETYKVIFLNKKEIECIYLIKDHLIFNDTLIVMLDVPLKDKYNRNVFAYDSIGNKIWQIDNLFPNDNDCPYNMMKIDENELLHLYNWCGFVVKLNPLTGEVIDRIFTK